MPRPPVTSGIGSVLVQVFPEIYFPNQSQPQRRERVGLPVVSYTPEGVECKKEQTLGLQPPPEKMVGVGATGV